ncbi:MAG: MBL fold metallo-hydrolase [Nitrospiria bacterium]
MLFKSFPVGPFQCNCIILGCEKTKTAMVIDPGGDLDRILEVLSFHKLSLHNILHTHAHLDHVGATEALKKKMGGTTGLHEDDMELVQNLSVQADLFGLPTPDTPVIDQFLVDGLTLGCGNDISVEILHTPGHTPGSLSFYIPSVGLMTGDTLFAKSIGRTDLWGGSHSTLISSIKKKLLSFPDETTVYPGHGPKTTIETERKENPFLT